jgi:hypothetical protein
LKVYLANNHIDGIDFALRYEAADEHEAQLIAQENDWEYLGEFMWEEDCPDDVLAMLERRLLNPSLH